MASDEEGAALLGRHERPARPSLPSSHSVALVTVVQVSTRSVERCGVGDHIGMESMSLHLMESRKAFSVKLHFRMC